MNAFSNPDPVRVWFDTNIGTSPGAATALLFALKRPEIEIVGISISGRQQHQRAEEAQAVLDYAGENEIPIYLGEKVNRTLVDAQQPDATITTGPLTNIAKLVLDEATLGSLHILGGAFRTVYYRGTSLNYELNIAADKDSARIVLTQYDNITLSSFEASSLMMLIGDNLEKIEKKHPFLESRFEGFRVHLIQKYGEDFASIILPEVLCVCDILNVPTITREIVEFKFQPNGTFLSTTPLDNCPEPIQEQTDNPDSVPVPTVKHQVIRSTNYQRLIEELVNTL